MRLSLRTERSERKWNKAVSIDQQSIPLGQPIQNGAQHHRRSFVPAHCMLCMRSAQWTRTNLRAFLPVADLSSRSLPRGLLGGNTCLRQPNARGEPRPMAGARHLDRDKARCTMHVSSSPPFRTRRATFTAPGSAPAVLLHGQEPHEASLRISPAYTEHSPCTACAFAGYLCSGLSAG